MISQASRNRYKRCAQASTSPYRFEIHLLARFDVAQFQSKLSTLIEFPREFQNAKRFQYKLATQASASQTTRKCTRLRVELVLAQHQNLRVQLVMLSEFLIVGGKFV